MKITKKELSEMIKEEVSTALVPDGKKVVALMKDFDDLIEETIEKAKKLADDGEEILQSNILGSPEVKSRNELLKTRIGMLRGIANSLSTTFERMKRSSP